MADTVSVIIPAYNAAEHVARAINSVLAQSSPPLEILVVDDGSSDSTVEVVSGFGPPVRLIRKENGGPASARNLGASLSQGEWLALLDADDWWFPDKLRAQLACATSPDIGLIHCLPDHRKDVVPASLTFDDLWARNWIINSSVLLRRTAFDAMHGFDEAKELISVEDYNFWVRLAASNWRIVTCRQVLVHYTRGIGLSSHVGRYLRAQLSNTETLGRTLRLREEVVRRKQNEILVDFGRRALYERDLLTARRLFRRAFSREKTLRNGLHVAISSTPRALLDIPRKTKRLFAHDPEEAVDVPAETAEAGLPWLNDPKSLPASIIDRRCWTHVSRASLPGPMLITTVDSEEDFDWTRPFSRASTDVTSMRSQHLAHRIFERYGVIPTYMVDHPVAAQDAGRAPLRELLQGGLCDIGAQLHPWVTPPFSEYVSSRNSYPGNLPAALEFAKIRTLTAEIETAFGLSPGIFRAGRYGVGANTGKMLRHLGYLADSSVVPCWNFGADGGPDFRRMTSEPYWIDQERTVLELPLAAALVGRTASLPECMTNHLFGRIQERLGIPSVMAHLGLLERIKLTPEGIAIEEAKRLVQHMVANGQRVFVMTYHSPSLEPGNTPYVRTAEDLQRFLGWLDEFYAFFTQTVGGTCATWRDVRNALLSGAPIAATGSPGFAPVLG